MSVPPGACDVLVVGLGPVGLLLTSLLRRHGCDVIAIDRDPIRPDEPRAAVLDDEALRALQAAGAADAVVSAGVVQQEAELRLRKGNTVTLMRMPARTANGHPGLVGLHQPLLETELAANLTAMTFRGWELTALEQHTDTATAVLTRNTIPNPSPEVGRVRARWVVGCDGAGSTVRRLAGVSFAGTTFAQRWLVVDAAVEEPGPRRVTFTGDPAAPAVTLPLTPSLRRWEVMVGDAEPAPEVLARGARPVRSAVYTFHARTAERWRSGRVLLAGDAAHVMPPFAGQGLGSGLRDAANLAWKLAAVVNGRASPALLNSYEQERRPHVAQMTALARFVGAIVQTRRARLASARDATLSVLDGTGVASRLQAGAAKPRATLRRDAVVRGTPGAGALLPQPDVRLGDGDTTRLDDVLGPGWAVVAREPVTAPHGVRAVVLGDDVHDESSRLDAWLARHGAAAALVRPDRHVYATAPRGRDLPVVQL